MDGSGYDIAVVVIVVTALIVIVSLYKFITALQRSYLDVLKNEYRSTREGFASEEDVNAVSVFNQDSSSQHSQNIQPASNRESMRSSALPAETRSAISSSRGANLDRSRSSTSTHHSVNMGDT